MYDLLLFNQLQLASQYFQAYETQHHVSNTHVCNYIGYWMSLIHVEFNFSVQ